MNTGKNQPSPCGSGKKHKKCCLVNDGGVMTDALTGKYFDLKGKKAEQLVHHLAEKSFFIDWCYANPKLPSGKELCDLLVVYDNVAIIEENSSELAPG